ncbi:Rve domain containing hypothetical protein [Phytophthora palmivora]|uniref:Integrase catalytic domain-containing protein n=1 Tax=Phytophthora palmivora TaxID=4796 RepID=A0A2P4WZP1_9STRA|nr:Rve domain containing hypothetical protein [Phytophthora palmivora]
MGADDFPRHPEKPAKSAGTKTPGGCTYVVTFIDDYSHHVTVDFMKAKSDVMLKFKMFKAAVENATGQRIKRPRSYNGGEYTGRQFKAYLNQCDTKHKKTVPYTPHQNGLAESVNRSLVEMARCRLYHDSVDKKWWAEAVKTAAWIINRIPNSVRIKTPYEIVYKTKPQLKNLTVFKRRFMGYEDGVKGFRVMNVTTEIVRTVKYMEPSTSDHLRIVPVVAEGGDVIPLQHDTEMDGVMVPYGSTHPMITRSRTRLIDEMNDPEDAGAIMKQIVAQPGTGIKRKKMIQERVKPSENRLAIEKEQAVFATGDVSKAYEEATTNADAKQWKRVIARFEIEQCGVDTAFPYGKLEEEIYMELPEGLRELLSSVETEEEEDDVGYLLLQRLNGLIRASRVWNENICAHLKSMGFNATAADPCNYTGGKGDDECNVCLYVDGMLIASRENDIIASVKAGITEKFRIKDLGRARFILGMEIDYDMNRKALAISQRAYIELIIKSFGQANAKPSLTPLDLSVHMTKNDNPQDAYSDADWAGNRDDRRSVSGMMLMMCGAPVVRRSTLQKTVALSSTEAENVALSECTKEVVWMRLLLKDVGAEQVEPTVIYEDNQGQRLWRRTLVISRGPSTSTSGTIFVRE